MENTQVLQYRMDHGRSLSGVFYAGRICHGGDRIYKSEKTPETF